MHVRESKCLIPRPVGQRLWCSCQRPSRWHTPPTSPPRSFSLMSLCWADASVLHGQWKRHSWWLGAGRGLPWSTTICLGRRLLWCRAPGILQYVFMLFTHNALCNALFIMMHLWYWDACVCYILVGTTLCIFSVWGHSGFSLCLQEVSFGLRLSVGMSEQGMYAVSMFVCG